MGIVEGVGGDRGFVPTQERLYAGGATSVRGFQQNELGSLVYIAGAEGIDTIPNTDTTFWMRVSDHPDSLPRVERTVPLGGNTLIVANIDYRIRDPFFLPDVLQYSFFLDAGEVWTRTSSDANLGFSGLKWTPGVGVRAFTPVGPVQVNVGYNNYARESGPLYFNPDVNTLHCVSPLNTIDLRRNAANELEQVDPSAVCPGSFRPQRPMRFLQRLTFTFSVGSEF
jgi:outer membrane protein insertion porin family/translocation and assembly module TamA